jgi:RHS repeat-associated protein
VANGMTFNAAGELLTRTLNPGTNAISESFSYNNRLQLSQITASVASTSVMNFTYNYGTATTNTGRVLSRTDAIQAEHNMVYGYDSIYRLGQAISQDASWDISWGFDVWGNRTGQTPRGLATSKVGTQTSGYTNNRNTTFTYDAAGNQTNDGLHNYTFNAENQITQMDGGAAVYVYDGEGRRMKRTATVQGVTETTYYFYGPGGVLCEFSTVAGTSTATTASANDRATYRTSDKLGSAVLFIASSGSVVENNRTLPYGEPWLNDVKSVNDKKFTTYQRDQESGLDYAMNRYYSNSGGRFVSADPYGGSGHVEEPSSWNRYVYVANDPINSHDADGLFRQCPRETRAKDDGCVPIFPPDPLVISNIEVLRREWKERDQEKRRIEFAKKVGKARDEGVEKLGKADADCEALFTALGLTSTAVQLELRYMNFEDGTSSLDLIENAASLAYARATGTTGWTVADLFRSGGFPPTPEFVGPLNTRLDGWSPPGGTAYLRPSAVRWDLLVHETLHQFRDMSDQTIMKAWGLDINGPSSQISDRIKEKCN